MTAAKRPTLAEVRRWPPTVDVAQAALAIGCSRSSAYESIRRGEFPASVITVGCRKHVLTASLIGIMTAGEAASAADRAAREAADREAERKMRAEVERLTAEFRVNLLRQFGLGGTDAPAA